MKNILLIITLAIGMMACEKEVLESEVKEVKVVETQYINNEFTLDDIEWKIYNVDSLYEIQEYYQILALDTDSRDNLFIHIVKDSIHYYYFKNTYIEVRGDKYVQCGSCWTIYGMDYDEFAELHEPYVFH